MAAPASGTNLAGASYRGLAALLGVMAILIFLPAWSLHYWQGWLYLVLFAAATLAITLYFLTRDPELIRRRLAAGFRAETERAQQIIQAFASLCFLAMFVVSALDHRWHWSSVPDVLALIADVFVALGFGGVFLTFRENSFTAAAIQVEDAQTVISTGPYAVVRHPMYASAVPLVLATPVALGSLWGAIPAVLLVLAIAARLLDEERFLIRNLPGYARYTRVTRYRLVPGVW